MRIEIPETAVEVRAEDLEIGDTVACHTPYAGGAHFSGRVVALDGYYDNGSQIAVTVRAPRRDCIVGGPLVRYWRLEER